LFESKEEKKAKQANQPPNKQIKTKNILMVKWDEGRNLKCEKDIFEGNIWSLFHSFY
jgi:hypothetical protein